MKFLNKNLKKINKMLNLKNIIKFLKKIIKFFKKYYIIILFLIIYLIKNNFRENFESVNECTPVALPEMKFCGNEKDLPKTQASNFIKNFKMQLKYYLKIIEDNMDKSDEVFKSTIIVAKSKSDKLNKKWNKDTKKPKDLKNWILEDNGRKEKILKYLEMKIGNDEDLKKTLENGSNKIKKFAKKYAKFEKDIGPKKMAHVVDLLIYLVIGPNFWKTIFEANGIEEDGFLYKDKYKENSLIYIEEIVKGLNEIHDDVIKKHSIYKKYKIDDK
jgi:hypothetical protein